MGVFQPNQGLEERKWRSFPITYVCITHAVLYFYVRGSNLNMHPECDSFTSAIQRFEVFCEIGDNDDEAVNIQINEP